MPIVCAALSCNNRVNCLTHGENRDDRGPVYLPGRPWSVWIPPLQLRSDMSSSRYPVHLLVGLWRSALQPEQGYLRRSIVRTCALLLFSSRFQLQLQLASSFLFCPVQRSSSLRELSIHTYFTHSSHRGSSPILQSYTRFLTNSLLCPSRPDLITLFSAAHYINNNPFPLSPVQRVNQRPLASRLF